MLDDEEENHSGLKPLDDDSDDDNLSDGFELTLKYDPLDANWDCDAYNDYEEYIRGNSPYVYEYENDQRDPLVGILYGVLCGDFVEDEDVDGYILIGQVAGGFIPYVADGRDVIANLGKGDLVMAGASGIGFVPVGGDLVKGGKSLAKTIAKLGDDVPTITKLIIEVAEKCPSIVKYFGESDEIADAIKKASVSPTITDKNLDLILKYADEAGIVLNRAGDVLDGCGDVIYTGQQVWSMNPIQRGKAIDEYINKHSIGKGLGECFPVVDRVEKGVLISTKSIDLSAKSYRDPKKLEARLNAYLKQLDSFEKKYPKVESAEGLKWGDGKPLKRTDYTSKKLELVIPNIPLTEAQKEILEQFRSKRGISIVIIGG